MKKLATVLIAVLFSFTCFAKEKSLYERGLDLIEDLYM